MVEIQQNFIVLNNIFLGRMEGPVDEASVCRVMSEGELERWKERVFAKFIIKLNVVFLLIK